MSPSRRQPVSAAEPDAASPDRPDEGQTAGVWMRPEQVELVEAAASLGGLRIEAAGCAEAGRSLPLAERLGAKPLDDVRAALASTRARVFILASAEGLLGERAAEDAALLRECAERGTRVVSLEPVPASIVELASGAPGGSIDGAEDVAWARETWARFVPRSRGTRAMRDAADVLAQFGVVRSASIECLGAPAHGTLGARLLDAVDLVLGLMGEPEGVDASYTGAHGGQAVHSLPGETLRGLHGDVSAHLRLADGRACTILASNQAGRWERVVTLLGTGGRLRIYNDGFEWIGIGGERVDQSRARRGGPARDAFKPPTARGAEIDAPSGFAAAVAEQISELLRTGPSATGDAMDASRALAVAQAALLSARTGEGESVSTIRRMGGLA
ncbi:MAG: hypothetical protein JNK35_08925 [Phycisphaerae bacterium]|nr:hypothetical protein [Phycisphaerae bacterium]